MNDSCAEWLFASNTFTNWSHDAINLFPSIEHETLGTYKTVNIPMRFRNADVKPRSRSPLIGEHTQQILSDAGLSEDELERLKQQQIIAQQ